jgi:transcriptional regulator NrdR family protein
MKVKCPFCSENGFNIVPDRHGEPEQEPCPNCNTEGYMDVEIPTADLIAELEKRRPCDKCNSEEPCLRCVWYSRHDNFKPSKGEK